ncbi:uncharacterized protein METZ01_LOCUS134371 [marine metagenome]|uniref:Uncharacterized protein n=1 Tax=marine metagenome TaxID=408172 RepID=A0A381YYH7_9ZZZZ
MLNTNLCSMVYAPFSSEFESSTAGLVDLGSLTRLPFSSIMPSLNASVSLNGVVSNLRNR